MTITLEMFRALCTFDQIMPLFLNFIFGFGRKTKSFDEDYMACYHQFSTSEDARIEALSKNRDEIHSLDDNQKLRANSYGQCVLISRQSHIVKAENSHRRFMLQHPPFWTTWAGPWRPLVMPPVCITSEVLFYHWTLKLDYCTAPGAVFNYSERSRTRPNSTSHGPSHTVPWRCYGKLEAVPQSYDGKAHWIGNQTLIMNLKAWNYGVKSYLGWKGVFFKAFQRIWSYFLIQPANSRATQKAESRPLHPWKYPRYASFYWVPCTKGGADKQSLYLTDWVASIETGKRFQRTQ